MKILVNEIPPDGMTVKGELSPSKLDLDTGHISFSSPISVECFLMKLKDDLIADCKLTTKARETCSRCLAEFDVDIKKQLQLHYELRGQLSIELDDNLKDEIILDCPIKILCSKDCKGLCPQCGKNLNEGPCNCKGRE
jgi:uncharacterized protein